MKKQNEIKPCPFCGCKSASVVWLYKFGCRVVCKRCKCETTLKRKESEAISRWNTRKDA